MGMVGCYSVSMGNQAIRIALLTALVLHVGACGDASHTVGSVCASVVDGASVGQGGEMSTVWVGCPGCCTGTYIAPGVVLTAAHCGNPAQVGTETTVGNNILHVPHPDYSFPHNDIALIFLDRELDRPIATLGAADYGDAVIQGYGVQRDGSKGEIMQASVIIEEFRANPSSIVTDSGADSCYGDSGGPLYQNGIHVGITRQGVSESPTSDPIDACGLGGIYTPTVKHYDWLNSEVANIQWNSTCAQ